MIIHAQEVLFYIVIIQNKDDEEMYSQLQLSQITIATACSTSAALCTNYT